MYIRNVVLAGLAAASTVQAFNETVEHDGWIVEYPVPVAQKKRTLSGILGVLEGLLPKPSSPPAQGGTCPPIWTQISATLTQQFSANGQCTDAARAAIRAAFHDCFPGACDGSLILANECAQPVNAAMTRICSNLANVASQTKVGVADLIQFAAAHAIKTCPGGPIVPVKVGRKDSSVANDIAILPSGFARGDDLVRLFGSKGFSPVDLSALIGAHSTAKQQGTDPARAGAALDTTPGAWDVKYYSETLAGTAPFTLQSDKNIARNPATAQSFQQFARSQGAWNAAFVPAMVKMSMMGVNPAGLIDCTSALPGGNRKREEEEEEEEERTIFGRLRF